MRTLRELIAGDRAIAAPLVMNPIMAKLAERAGFEVLYLGGGSMGYLKTILEANLNLTEMIQAGVDIRAACSLPLILDAAAGWGDPMHLHRTIAMTEAAGFAGIEIEDQVLPKRAHHHIGIEHMVPCDLMVAKIQEAVAARRSDDLVIIGRTNGIRASNMDDALTRAEAYRKAGADVLMLGARRPEEYAMVGERLGPPLMYNMGAGGLAALGMTLDDLGRLGCRLLTDPRHPFILAYRAWKEGYQALADGMLTPGLDADEVGEIERDLFDTINLKGLIDIEKRTVERP